MPRGPRDGRRGRAKAGGRALTRIVYLGTADFAVPALASAARASGWEIASVVTEPAKPKGRGKALAPTPVAEAAARLGLPLRAVATWRDEAARAWLRDLAPDVLITAAYGRILPQAVLSAARYGAVNLHGSLLPAWRGAAPVQRAIEAGDARTGVSIFCMDAGVDTGPVIGTFAYDIPPAARAGETLAALAEVAAMHLAETVDGWVAGRLAPRAQPAESPTPYAAQIRKEEGVLEWDLPAEAIARRVRAFHPWPGVTLPFGGERISIRAAVAHAGSGAPGEILSRDPFLVACRAGTTLEILRAARAGRNELDGPALANGLRA